MLCARVQCLKGAGIWPFAAISAQVLALLVEGEEGRRAEGWTSEFSTGTSECPTWALRVPAYTWTSACVFGTLPVLSGSYNCASNRYYLSRKLALLTSFDHHGCSKTATITLIHKTNFTHLHVQFVFTDHICKITFLGVFWGLQPLPGKYEQIIIMKNSDETPKPNLNRREVGHCSVFM